MKNAASLPPHSAIFWHLMNVDAAGVAHETNTALNRLSASANAPIFSFLDVFFGEALVGGPMQSSKKTCEAAAAVALRILEGEKAGDIKTPIVENGLPKFDWLQLQRWHISEQRLPPNSEIYFREPGLWQRYPGQIALSVVLILIQAGLIAVLLHERSRRHLAQVQSRQRMAELAHINRYSTAGELTASIAHEINQPLGAILVNAETARSILTSSRPDLDELRDIVDDILQDDRRAGEVIRRTRSLLRKAPFELTKLDLNAVVRETVEFLSALAIGRKVELGSVLTPIVLPIIGDRIQLQQVILNLAVNAIDAMVDMPVENRYDQHPDVARRGLCRAFDIGQRPGDLPAEKLKEIFEPFFTSKAEGMGMGLSIARTIVEAHKGRIWAENRPGSGASFRIRLPLEETTD